MKFSLLFVLAFIAFRVEAEMTKEQKKRCEQYTSIFENDTIELQYAYVENIDDGRGYTSGRAGFCTGTGDAYEVVKKYTAKKKNNPLAKYLPEMKRLAEKASSDTSKLKGYPSAWKEAAKDPVFIQTQDEVSDELYYRPAMKYADKLGIKSALGECAIYDCIIQHGDDPDPDSIGAIINKTKAIEHGVVKANEKEWIRTFLKTRRYVLLHPSDKETAEAWKGSEDRVDAMLKQLDAGNMDWKGPIHVKTPEHSATVP